MTTSSTQDIRELAKKQLELSTELKELEAKIKYIKAQLNSLSRMTLPDMLDEADLGDCKVGQYKITLTDKIEANITEANKDKAYGWLIKNGHDDIIKNQLIINFGKGDTEASIELSDVLKSQDFNVEEKYAVNKNTLKKWAREQYENGVDIPEDLFGIFRFRETKVEEASG